MSWMGTTPHELGSGQIIGVHAIPAACLNPHCPPHVTAIGPLADAPQWWNPEAEEMSRVCRCGNFHPDPDFHQIYGHVCSCWCCVS